VFPRFILISFFLLLDLAEAIFYGFVTEGIIKIVIPGTVQVGCGGMNWIELA